MTANQRAIIIRDAKFVFFQICASFLKFEFYSNFV